MASPLKISSTRVWLVFLLIFLPVGTLFCQQKRKVIIDEDCSGPGGTAMQAITLLINSPATDVLGITVVTGDAWRDEEVAHALRLLETVGRTDIPVVPGAVFSLVRTKEDTAKWEKRYGKVPYQGAWNYGRPVHGPWEIPAMPEGKPRTKAASEDAAHFLVRMVRRHPHQVTIYAGGPLTNLALAQALDPEFASLSRELVVMGGSIHPQTRDPEFIAVPHREFNFWMDPEAAHSVLHAPWPRITVTTVDISVKTRMTRELIAQIARSNSPAAQYAAKYAQEDYLWDELAAMAWLDPTIITHSTKLYMDVSIDRGSTYGDTLTWTREQNGATAEPLVEVPENLDTDRFYLRFIDLITRSTPGAH
jgi:inosine-uridine nucleoside N-ribohydrolase